MFQSTPPRGRRRARRDRCAAGPKVSIHASAREATWTCRIQAMPGICFNPRLREGGDATGGPGCCATFYVSIHASAREATHRPAAVDIPGKRFNPRLREGGDAKNKPTSGNSGVSIHASAREATWLP